MVPATRLATKRGSSGCVVPEDLSAPIARTGIVSFGALPVKLRCFRADARLNACPGNVRFPLPAAHTRAAVERFDPVLELKCRDRRGHLGTRVDLHLPLTAPQFEGLCHGGLSRVGIVRMNTVETLKTMIYLEVDGIQTELAQGSKYAAVRIESVRHLARNLVILLRRGHSEKVVRGVLGENVLRLAARYGSRKQRTKRFSCTQLSYNQMS